MAVMILEPVVLRGLRVVRGVKGEIVRSAADRADGRALALPSHSRQPSHNLGRPAYPTATRFARARAVGKDAAASRAGRPFGCAGMPVRQGPAMQAGRAVQWRWPAPLTAATRF